MQIKFQTVFSRKSALKFVDQRMNMDDEGEHKISKYIPWLIETYKGDV